MPVTSCVTTAERLAVASTPRGPEGLADRELRAFAEKYPGLAAWLPDEERQRLGLPVDPAPPKRWRFRRMDNGAHIADAVEMPGGKTVLLMPNGGYVGFGTFDEVVSHLGAAGVPGREGFRWSCLDAPPAPPAAPAPVEAQGEDWAYQVASSLLDGLREHLCEAPSNLSVSAVLAERTAKALRDVREWAPDRIVGAIVEADATGSRTRLRLKLPSGQVVEVVGVYADADGKPLPLHFEGVAYCARCGASCASLVACETCGSGGAVGLLPRWVVDMIRKREALERDQAAEIGARMATKAKETP